MSIDYVFFSITIHDEILTEIFSRVPAKTVGKFRTLSKTWLTNLTNSHFINLHLSRNTNQQSLILLSQSNSIQTIKPPFFDSSKILELGNGNSWTQLLGSCNGLVLLSNQEREMFLVNPTTREQFKVPFIVFKKYGFGYDSVGHDYKIVTVTSNYSTGIVQVDLYSVKVGVWKRIDNALKASYGHGSYNGVFVNGCLNWTVNKRKLGVLFTVLGFDLAMEVFREFDVPLSILGQRGQDVWYRLFDHGGCLCSIGQLISHTKRTEEEMWMMREYGNVNSWTKLATLDGNGRWWMCVPLCASKDEIVLMAYADLLDEEKVAEEQMMVVYDLRQGMVNEVVVNGVVASLIDCCSFVDSLVSLKEFSTS